MLSEDAKIYYYNTYILAFSIIISKYFWQCIKYMKKLSCSCKKKLSSMIIDMATIQPLRQLT